MKKIKKIAALTVAAAMMLCLTACGSFETKAPKAVKAMSQVENLHMDMDMQIDMAFKVLGKSADMAVTVDGAMDMQIDPLTAKLDMLLSAKGLSRDLQSYVEKAGDEYKVYISADGGDDWEEKTVSADDAPSQINIVDGMQLFVDCASSFKEVGEEKIRGSAATRYDGIITGENVGAAMELTGVGDMLSQSLGTELSEEDFSKLGSIPTSIWIDKDSGMVVRYDMDLTQVMQDVLPGILGEALGSFGLSGLSDKLSVNGVTVSIVLSRFNKVGEVTIPDEVRAD